MSSPPCTVKIALFVVLLTACASAGLTFEDVAGVYGCETCLLAGNTLYLWSDGTYTRCEFSDVPELDGHFFRKTSGSYVLNGQRFQLATHSLEPVSYGYLVRIHRDIYMITESVYLEHGNNTDIVKDLGFARRPLVAGDEFVCAD